MVISLNKKITDLSSLHSRYNGKNIILSIDSSKTNTAIAVHSRTYKVIDLIEFDGSNDKDILELTKEQRNALRVIFKGSNILDAGIEDIITKKEEEAGGKFSEGLKHHHSRYVITAVFVSIIVLFQDEFNIRLELIPNQAWKAAVLPKDLNRRSVYKGSVIYIRDKYPQYITGKKDDDGADAICIGEYMKMRKGISNELIMEDIPDEEEFSIHPCFFRLYPATQKIKKDISVAFLYNNSLSLEANARAIANRLTSSTQLGYAVCDIRSVDISDIYSLCVGNFSEHTTEFKLIVKRVE